MSKANAMRESDNVYYLQLCRTEYFSNYSGYSLKYNLIRNKRKLLCVNIGLGGSENTRSNVISLADVRERNLIRAVEQGLLSWAQFFEQWRGLPQDQCITPIRRVA